MKKTLLSIAAAALVFASCDNENSVNPQPLGTVTINGTVYADLDEDDDAGDPEFETIPAGVVIYFYNDDTGALVGQATTNADGQYSAQVEIGVRPIDFEIVVGDFQTTINVYDFVEDDFVSKQAIYNERESAFVLGAVKDATYIQNIEISQPEVINFD